MAAVQTMLQEPALTTIKEQHQSAACSGFVAPATQNVHVVYDDVPLVVHASEQKYIKSEDVIFVRSTSPVLGDVHRVFMVCDGHMGVGAADHCVTHMPGLLNQLLPQHLPDWTIDSEVEVYAEKVRRAVSTAAVLLDNDWAQLNDNSGTTLTLAVLSGWLLTIANTGDSSAIVDCGDDVQEITYSHRIQVNKGEQDRLRKAGAQLAPVGFHLQGPAKPQEMGVGPLRMWPGGLCVSRSIGDVDAGPLIVPLPHVRQVVVNRSRALRLILASDGLWDLMSFSKVAKSVRHKLPPAAVAALMQMAVRDRRMADDISIIIADVLPPVSPGVTPQQFPAAALKASGSSGGSSGSSRSSGSGGLFRCFKASPVENDGDIQPPQPSQPSPPQPQRLSLDMRLRGGLARLSGRGTARRPGPPAKPWLGLQWFSDVDCFEAYPMQLARTEVVLQRPKTPPKRVGDYTVHGGQAHRFQQDSSWHTGNSHHGSSELPVLLSQQQLEQLQADGPAAAASMCFSSSSHHTPNGSNHSHHHPQQQQQQQQMNTSSLYGSSSDSVAQERQHHQLPRAAASAPPPAAAAAAGSGTGRMAYPADATNGGSSSSSRTPLQTTAAAAAPPPLALSRSASAQFEGADGVYVAPGDSPQGLGVSARVVQATSAAAALSHFGSAPDAVAGSSSGGGGEGHVHSGRGALAAAVADDDAREHRTQRPGRRS